MSSHFEDFFVHKSILITGGSGFVGKCLLEKILRSCPQLDTIYVLLRPKGGQTAQKRLQNLFSSEVFQRVKQEFGHQLAKVVAVSGDVTLHQLGLSPTDRDSIIQNVNLVMNCAATIRFDEPLRRALQLNVGSVLKVLQLAQKCSQLQALVHVSTAYCTRDRQHVLEEIPFESYSPLKLLEASEWMSDSMLDSLAEQLFGGRPSSYHFTKALAEQLLAESDVPLAIVRPSIIVGAWKEPFEGWIDNYNGISGFLVATGKGVLRSLHCRPDLKCDVIPVDLVVNTVLMSATKASRPPFVVNCVSGASNPISWREITSLSLPLLYEFPSEEVFRPPNVCLHSSAFVNYCHLLIEHTIPSLLIDLLFRFCGLSPILGKVYQKVNRSSEALKTFTLNEWLFEDNNYKLLSKVEKSCDVKEVDWNLFFRNFVFGIRKYLLKEKEKSLLSAKTKLKNLQMAIFLAKSLLFFGFVFKIMRKIQK